MNFLAVDVGNSHIGIGAVEEWRLGEITRIDATESDSIEKQVEECLDRLPPDSSRKVVICSVNSELLEAVIEATRNETGADPMIVGEEIDPPIIAAVEEPDRVGMDRICAAAAAYDRVQQSVAVADFGSAITIDCVNAYGIFQGGAILPGLRLSARSLHEHTSALPLAEIKPPIRPIAKNTEEAISNGVFLGAIGALREIVERYATDLGQWPHLVVGGGDAEIVAKNCDFVDSISRHLCLHGVVLAYYRHLGNMDSPPR
jgi:type III pantothenate kinase